MNTMVASSSIADRDINTERAPAAKKARAIPTTPSPFKSLPRPLWQQLKTTRRTRRLAASTSDIWRMKSFFWGSLEVHPLFGDKAISPVRLFPWAAMWIIPTDDIRFITSASVASLPVRRLVLRINSIISTWHRASRVGVLLTHLSADFRPKAPCLLVMAFRYTWDQFISGKRGDSANPNCFNYCGPWGKAERPVRNND